MHPVSIVTIKNKIPLYKKDEPANSIELIELEEVGFELVAQKDLYKVGEKAIYVQPDYNVSDIPLFESYIRPNGNESKSMLGKVEGLPRRIRAKKFTLSKEPNGDPVYSNGILLPYNEVFYDLSVNIKNLKNLEDVDLTKELGITKYEEPEHTDKYGIRIGLPENKFPKGIYKTDEENINNLWNHLENKIGYPVRLVGTEKVDGSSITIGITPEFPEGFICSRNLRKKLTINKIVGRREPNLWEIIKSWFGVKTDLNLYEEVQNDDDFVRFGIEYLNMLKFVGDTNLIFRGELNGGKLKGSGNKNNPASKLPANIKFFGVDVTDELGNAIRLPHSNFKSICNLLDFPMVDEVFHKEFSSKEELLTECNNYFKTNMIEGIVVRTGDSKFSAKVMNLEYDSKK